MKTFAQIGTETGQLVERKNAAYGSSFAKTGDYLRLLYPDGLRPDQFDDALLLARDFDKSMRIATSRNAFGESPWEDKAGYAILGVHLHQAAELAKEERAGAELCGYCAAPLPIDAPRWRPFGLEIGPRFCTVAHSVAYSHRSRSVERGERP